jgi:hypothetical protein
MGLPRIGYRTALPSATVKTLYMSSDGLGTAVSQAFTKNGAASATDVTKAAGTNFAATAVGCMIRCLTATVAANVGQVRKCTVRNGNDQLTCNAFPGNMTAGDTFILEREVQTLRKVKLTIEPGGHAHVSINKGAALVTDPKIDDTMIKTLQALEGFTQVDILTDSDVHTIYINVEAE